MKELLFPWVAVPGIILLGAVLALYFAQKRRLRPAKIALLGTIIIGWVVSTVAFSQVLSAALVSMVSAPVIADLAQIDGIVVLTGGMDYTGEQTGWIPSHQSYRRLAVALDLQNRVNSRIPVIISGGRTHGVQYPSEAYVAQQFFDRFRSRVTPTILEESSTNTYESSLQIAALMQKREMREVFLVTSETHMLRSLATFNARGIRAVPFPALDLPRGDLGVWGYMPTWEGAMYSSRAIYELVGTLVYVLSGYIHWGHVFSQQQGAA